MAFSPFLSETSKKLLFSPWLSQILLWLHKDLLTGSTSEWKWNHVVPKCAAESWKVLLMLCCLELPKHTQLVKHHIEVDVFCAGSRDSHFWLHLCTAGGISSLLIFLLWHNALLVTGILSWVLPMAAIPFSIFVLFLFLNLRIYKNSFCFFLSFMNAKVFLIF